MWRSVRKTGDTKTAKSRRSLRLPTRCVEVQRELKTEQNQVRGEAGSAWIGRELVFRTMTGTHLRAGNVRREFRTVLDRAGLVGVEWTPRGLRHSFVSLLSAHDIPIENISRLVRHTNTVVTETVYRKQIRPCRRERPRWTPSSRRNPNRSRAVRLPSTGTARSAVRDQGPPPPSLDQALV